MSPKLTFDKPRSLILKKIVKDTRQVFLEFKHKIDVAEKANTPFDTVRIMDLFASSVISEWPKTYAYLDIERTFYYTFK